MRKVIKIQNLSIPKDIPPVRQIRFPISGMNGEARSARRTDTLPHLIPEEVGEDNDGQDGQDSDNSVFHIQNGEVASGKCHGRGP